MKLLIFSFFLFLTHLCFAQSRAELEKRRSATLNEISETENILQSVTLNKLESLDRLKLLDKKLYLRNRLIVDLSSEVSSLDNKISDSERMIESLNGDIKRIKSEYSHMIYLAYMNRGRNDKLIFVLSSRDFNQAYKRIKYLKQYSEYRKRQISIIHGVQSTLNVQVSDLDLTKKDKIHILSIQEKEVSKLKVEQDEKALLVSNLKTKESSLSKKLKEQNRLAEKLKDEIEKIIREEIEKAKALVIAHEKAEKAKEQRAKSKLKRNSKDISNLKSPSLSPLKSPSGDILLTNNFKENKGKLPWPTDKGIVTQPFGDYHHPIYKNVKMSNNGIDISTGQNSDVKAIFEGDVVRAISISGLNYVVIIKHGNYYSLYQNLSNINVQQGDKVKTHQTIGRVFSDSDSRASVLHVEIWEELKKLDPEVWLTRN